MYASTVICRVVGALRDRWDRNTLRDRVSERDTQKITDKRSTSKIQVDHYCHRKTCVT